MPSAIVEGMNQPPIIDHDPNEPPIDRGPGPWRWVFPVLAVVVIGNLAIGQLDLLSFLGGLGVGGVFAAWVIEITGNKVPASWRKASRARRP